MKVAVKTFSKVKLFDSYPNRFFTTYHKKGDTTRKFKWLPFPHFVSKIYEEDEFESLGVIYTLDALNKHGLTYANIDHRIYYLPNVEMIYTDGYRRVEYFKTYEEAKEYYKTILSTYGLIEIPEPNKKE